MSLEMQDYQNNLVDISNLPTISELNFETLAPEYVNLSTIETIVSWLFLLIPLTIVVFVVPQIGIPLWAIPIAVCLALLSTLYSRAAAKARGFLLRDKDILYKEGLWWQKQTGVSFKRIQHIDLTHGPIERRFKLATIKFFTAGGALADLKIPGLNKYHAENLRSVIIDKTGIEND